MDKICNFYIPALFDGVLRAGLEHTAMLLA